MTLPWVTSEHVKANCSTITENHALMVFRNVMDKIYSSFRHCVKFEPWPVLGQSMLEWAEMYCGSNELEETAATSVQSIRAVLPPEDPQYLCDTHCDF